MVFKINRYRASAPIVKCNTDFYTRTYSEGHERPHRRSRGYGFHYGLEQSNLPNPQVGLIPIGFQKQIVMHAYIDHARIQTIKSGPGHFWDALYPV